MAIPQSMVTIDEEVKEEEAKLTQRNINLIITVVTPAVTIVTTRTNRTTTVSPTDATTRQLTAAIQTCRSTAVPAAIAFRFERAGNIVQQPGPTSKTVGFGPILRNGECEGSSGGD